MKNIIIMGSTGSIGTQALDVIRQHDKEYNVVGLSARSSAELLIDQIKEFKPKYVCIQNSDYVEHIKSAVDFDVKIFSGEEGLVKLAKVDEGDCVLTAVVGIAGLEPTIEAIRNGKNIALANKETLVTAGEIVMSEARKYGVEILPVDSEHSAIFQSLNGEKREQVSKIILTASGGPFRTKNKEELKKVTLEQALKHPNWSMGKKITIDSATMMNKGLEVIEAKWLFDVEFDQIEILVHPQSIIHSMVEYVDRSVIAQLGNSDMRIPIQYALSYPDRIELEADSLDLTKISNLTFEKPDFEKFRCLRLAIEALESGGIIPCALNAANEVAVELFLNEKIEFFEISILIEETISDIKNIMSPTLDDIIKTDKQVRIKTLKNAKKLIKTTEMEGEI
ncbi:MAG: 1-deoxy-D-xylulose-5-phosphate reductoisomerase [Tissierellales bacterium]|jgi:1-deoxy-D-xylulose-5-phosphate reductoisomerase|nr:1-deoxy-D-xylulose-5-phosphate reductoisomerase [Tissierellales bacterium]